MNSLDKMMSAIYGRCNNPPVVIPYLQYYFPRVINKITPFTEATLSYGSLEQITEAHSRLHRFFDCDWIRVWENPPLRKVKDSLTSASSRKSQKLTIRDVDSWPPPTPAEKLVEQGQYAVASELVRRLKKEKFIYGRVGTPYTSLYSQLRIEQVMIALREEPQRCKDMMEYYLQAQLEQVRAWAMVGVHGLWIGEWLCSADIISETDYLEFVYPMEKVLLDAVRAAGLIDIFHFCGDVLLRLKYIRQLKPTCFGVEEPKKGFDIDIGRIRIELGKDVCLLGNIDAYEVVEKGTPEKWVREVNRQIVSAGSDRFIISCGSPITSDTSPWRLRDFIQTAKRVRDSLKMIGK